MRILKVYNINEKRVAYLNTDHIIAILPHTTYTDIILTDKIKCRVKEKPEELMNMIKE